MKDVSSYYPTQGRVVLHMDMNAFYCSVHAAEEPELYAGKATAVAGRVDLRRGILVTSSYEARKLGVRTGMQVKEALKLCPELILIHPNFSLYRRYSERIREIAYRYSPLVEMMSIDECYIDITGSKQFGTPIQIAESIQRAVLAEASLPCSIGIAPNKLLAKMASDMKKPGGITILRLRDVPKLLWHQPCDAMFGIGQKTAQKLAKLNVHTLGQLAVADDSMLDQHFGRMGSSLKLAARGIDHSPVNPERGPNKSIGHSTTLEHNLTEEKAIHKKFLQLADQVTRRLRQQRMLANTIQITIRDPSMRTITRATTLQSGTEDQMTVYKAACSLFREHWQDGKPVRLLGISLNNLVDKADAAIQLDLFDFEKIPQQEQLTQVLDRLRDKYGEDAIVSAGMIVEERKIGKS